jgi:hypothetical protein
VVVESLYPGEWKRYRAGIGSLRRQHEQREAQQRQKFDAWWQRWREMGGAAALLGDASSMRAA